MLSTGEEANIPVWYAQTEDIAKQIAQYLAGKKPGCQVCISELKQVAQAAAPRVGMAVFSDRGLVPA
jgi:menaquinone-dependent protoporphyrinogen IX oxidase